MPSSAPNQKVGIRFQNIQIPKNAAIVSAYLQFETDEIAAGNPATSLSIVAFAEDNTATFSTAANSVSSRSATSSVTWLTLAAWNAIGEAGTNQRSPDLSLMVQAIVNRSGWAAGNAIGFKITGSGSRVGKSYDLASGTGAPKLIINYEP